MSISRRELTAMLPALSLQGQEFAKTSAPVPTVMHSFAYAFESLPIHTNANGNTKSRPVFNGVTTRGQRITMHISELAPGQSPHAPERQPHEEVIVIREGTLEVTLNGKVSVLGPGSVIFSAFNELNGWKNVGDTPAQYYVFSLEERSAA